MKLDKSSYGTSATTLIKICIAAWGFCKDNLKAFAAIKPIYTATYIKNALQAVQDAQNLPVTLTTIGERTTARKNLQKATNTVMANWRQLKIYINNAYDKEMAPVKLEMAGASLYKRAAYDNWNSVARLIDAGNRFIADNTADLSANNNMPDNFPDTFVTNGLACSSLSLLFSNMAVTKEQATGNRVQALNAIHTSLMVMLRDGQHIFYADKILKKQFVFAYLRGKFGDNKTAGITGIVTDINGLPVQGATISTKDYGYTATTDKKGRYHLRLAEGIYTFIAASAGSMPAEHTVELYAGMGLRLNFALTSILLKKVA